ERVVSRFPPWESITVTVPLARTVRAGFMFFRGCPGLRGRTGPPPPQAKVMTGANGSEGRGKESFSCAAALRATVKQVSAVTSNRKRLTFVILAEIAGMTGIFTLDVLSLAFIGSAGPLIAVAPKFFTALSITRLEGSR